MGAISFVKMHGAGNDFVMLDGRRPAFDFVPYARLIANRRFGVGCDQLIILREPSGTDYDARMQILNADGSEVEMCGNGIRCFAIWLWRHIGIHRSTYRIETPAGLIQPTRLDNGLVRVDMGPATFAAEQLPASDQFFAAGQELINSTLEVSGTQYDFCGVQVGNPHFVTFVDDLDAVDLHKIGPPIETHAAFPNRINVEFAQITEEGARVGVWERGSGITLACGTGATAVGAALMATGQKEGKIAIDLPGGRLWIEQEKNRMFMTGPTAEVFAGTLDELLLQSAMGGLPDAQ